MIMINTDKKDEIVVEEQGCGLDETCDMDIEKVLSEEENIEATRKLRPHGPGCAAEGPVVNGFMNVVDL